MIRPSSSRSSVFAAMPSPPRQQGTGPPTTSIAMSSRPSIRSLPPSQSYVVLCKIVLQKRLRHMLTITALASYVILFISVFDPTAFPRSLFYFLPTLLFSPVAFLGAVPILVLRKSTLTTSASTEPSRLAQVLGLLQPSMLKVLLAYFLGSLPILSAYIRLSSSVSIDPRLGFFYRFDGDERGLDQLNERRVLLVLLSFALVVYSSVDHILRSRSQIKFDDMKLSSIPVRLLAKITTGAPRLAMKTLIANGVFYVSYIILRRPTLRFLVLHFLPARSRSHLSSFLTHNISVSIIARALASSFLTLAIWEIAHIVFEVYTTTQMSVSHFAPNPNQCLLSGLRSDDAYIRHFAFLELSLLSLTDPIRRKAIFMDLRPDAMTGGAWHDISRECLKVIGGELQRAKRGGRMSTTTASRSVSGSSQSSAASPSRSSPRAPVRNENVFRPVKKTYLDSLADVTLGSPSAPAIVTTSSTAITQSASNLVSRVPVPSIFQSSALSNLTPTPVAVTLPKANEIAPVEDRIVSLIPKRLRGSLYARVFGKRASVTVGNYLARKSEVIWSIQALANLLCASLREDPYGVAQGDITKVLEAFVLYLMELEKLTKTLIASVEGDEKSLERVEMLKEIEVEIESVENALKDGVRTIVDEFAAYMGEFRFAPKISIRLQLLIDWDGRNKSR